MAECEIAHIERDELGAPEATREAERDEGAVPEAQQARGQLVHHHADLACPDGLLLVLRDPQASANTLPGLLHQAMRPRGRVAAQLVGLGDGRERLRQGRDLAPGVGAGCEIERERLWRRWELAELLLRAPRAECSPLLGVFFACALRPCFSRVGLGGLDELGSVGEDERSAVTVGGFILPKPECFRFVIFTNCPLAKIRM